MTDKQKKTLFTITIAAYIVLVVVSAIVACLNVFDQSVENNPVTKSLSLELTVTGRDSLPDYTQKQLDSIQKIVTETKQEYIYHTDEALNNIRQETNNMINKINGWMSFWLCMLTIIAGIIPLLLQYKYNQDSKKVAEGMENSRETKCNVYLETIQQKLNNIDKLTDDLKKSKIELECRINRTSRESHDKLNSLFEELEIEKDRIALTSTITTFLIAKENKLFDDISTDRNLMLNQMMHKLYSDIEKLFDGIYVTIEGRKSQEVLLSSLIQILDLYKHFKSALIIKSKARQLDQQLKLIKELISDLSKGTIKPEEIKRRTKEIEQTIKRNTSIFYDNIVK